MDEGAGGRSVPPDTPDRAAMARAAGLGGWRDTASGRTAWGAVGAEVVRPTEHAWLAGVHARARGGGAWEALYPVLDPAVAHADGARAGRARRRHELGRASGGDLEAAVRDATDTWTTATRREPSPLARPLGHELMNALGTALGFLELVQDDLAPDVDLEHVELALDGVRRAAALVREARRGPPRRVDDVADLLVRVAERAGADLVLEPIGACALDAAPADVTGLLDAMLRTLRVHGAEGRLTLSLEGSGAQAVELVAEGGGVEARADDARLVWTSGPDDLPPLLLGLAACDGSGAAEWRDGRLRVSACLAVPPT